MDKVVEPPAEETKPVQYSVAIELNYEKDIGNETLLAAFMVE